MKPTCEEVRVPELASISSISSATPDQTNSNKPVVPIQCNESWKLMSSNLIAEKENNRKKIDDFVKTHLFKRLKFYNTEVMLYDTKKNSICQKVCDHLNMAEAGRVSFWNTYSIFVEKAVRVARNDTIQAMKISFLKGMYTNNDQLLIIQYLNASIFSRFCQGM